MKYLVATLVFLSHIALMAQQDSIADSVQLHGVIISAEQPSGVPGLKTREIDSIQRQNTFNQNLGEVLTTRTPVFIKSYGVGQLQTLSFRGMSASHTKIYYNGIQMNSPTLGQTDLTLIPVFFTEQIGLKYGNASFTESPGGLGGALMMGSAPKGLERGSHVMASFSLGSLSNFSFLGGYSWQGRKFSSTTKLLAKTAGNEFGYKNIAKYNEPNDLYLNGGFSQNGIFQEFGYRLNAQNELNANFIYTTAFRGIPATMVSEVPTNGGPSQNDDMLLGQLRWKGYYSKVQTGAVLSYTNTSLVYDNPVNSIHSVTKTQSWQARADVTWNISNRVAFQGNWNLAYESATNDNLQGANNIVRTSLLMGINAHLSKRWELGVFLQPTVLEDTIVPLLPMLSLAFMPTGEDWFVISANAARNVNAPTLNDRYWVPGGNPFLVPEESYQGELSFLVSRKNKKAFFWQIDASGYYGKVNNWIQWSPTDAGYWTAQNLKSVDNYGGELFVKLHLDIKKWRISFQTGYQYVHTVNNTSEQDPANGKLLIYTPENTLNWRLAARYKGMNFGFLYTYTGQRYVTSDNSVWLPAYDLLNFFFRYDFDMGKHGSSVRFDLNNVLGKQYMSVLWRPMPRQNFMVTISYKFR